MRFTVPQFIDYEAKIVGPLTFRQFVYVGMAGAVCFVLYFTAPFSLFLISCFVLGGGALAFAFIKIGGRSLPTILANLLRFSLTPKMYIWRKKETPVTVYKKTTPASAESALGRSPATGEAAGEEELPLKIAEKSRLKKMKIQIETKTK